MTPMTGKSAAGTFAAAGVALSCCVLAASPSAAQQRGSDSAHCAIYGAGYVAVQGSTTCVRIGGRVRLELNAGSIGNAYAPVANNAAGSPDDGLGRAHLRIPSQPARNR